MLGAPLWLLFPFRRLVPRSMSMSFSFFLPYFLSLSLSDSVSVTASTSEQRGRQVGVSAFPMPSQDIM